MKQHISLLKDKVHGINMTDNQSSVMRLSSLVGCHIIKEMGGVPILQMTGRDRNPWPVSRHPPDFPQPR